MAMRASKGCEAAEVVVGRDVRSVVEPPSRSPAESEGPPEELEDWIWEAAKSLDDRECQKSVSQASLWSSRTETCLPLDTNWQLPGAGHRLDDDVGLGDAAGK